MTSLPGARSRKDLGDIHALARGPAEALARLGLSLEEFLGEERVS